MSEPSDRAEPEQVPAGMMTPWDVGELPEPHRLSWSPRGMLGPGLLMAGAAIGGGEWLVGPAITSKYGGMLMWIAGISILLQACYNQEVMRYTLYSGEPILLGCFRTRPGPIFWTFAYLLLDFGAIWPYLTANAAVPLVAAFLGPLPGELPTKYLPVAQVVEQTGLPTAVVEELADAPNRFGPTAAVAKETGLPLDVVQQMAVEPQRYGNTGRWKAIPRGITDPIDKGEVEQVAARTGLAKKVVQEIAEHPERFGTVEQVVAGTGLPRQAVERMAEHSDEYGITERWKAIPDPVVEHWLAPENRTRQWVSYGIFLAAFIPLIFGGKIYNALEKVMTIKIIFVLGYLTFVGLFYVKAETWYAVFSGFVGSPGIRDGGFSFQFLPDLPEGQTLDFALLATFAAIAGAGGLSNTAFSNYCRDKGWGMGSLVGAIPSAVGGSTISLSHTGKVFRINGENLTRWQGWMRVIKRDQWAIWVIGCILGMAIPSLVSMEFIGDLGRDVKGDELAAVTARLLTERTGFAIFWWLTLLCGFMVLGPSQVSSMDGIIRRWTDIIWTGTPAARKLRGNQVKYIYYGLLTLYGIFGLTVLVLMPNPLTMVQVASIIFNYALGFSALHTLAVNCFLVPKELRPGWFMRGALVAAFLFFTTVSVIATNQFVADKFGS